MGTLVAPLSATTTVVSMTLEDINGFLWSGAKVTIVFEAAPNTAPPYLFDGYTFQMNYFFENIGSAGQFSIGLPSNLDITPEGEKSFWRFDIAPNADDSRSVNMVVQVSGPTMDLSPSFKIASQQIIKPLVQSIPIPRAAGDEDVIVTPNDGQLYFDTTLQVYKAWYNDQWNPIIGGGSGGGSGCTGSQNQILYLPNANMCAGNPRFLELGNGLNGGLSYTGNGANFNAQNSGSYSFSATDSNSINGSATTTFTESSAGVNSANFNVHLDTSSGTVNGHAGSGNINLYTTGNGANGNNIYLTAESSLGGGSGNITLEAAGAVLIKADGSNIGLQSVGGINLSSGSQPTSFSGGVVVQNHSLVLPADPTAPLQAATKQYVDASKTQVIQAPDEATALANSTANPNNIYWWPGGSSSGGGSGGMVYPGAGVAVSTGNTWGTSIDPSTLVTNTSLNSTLANYLPLAGGNLTGDVSTTGDMTGVGFVATGTASAGVGQALFDVYNSEARVLMRGPAGQGPGWLNFGGLSGDGVTYTTYLHLTTTMATFSTNVQINGTFNVSGTKNFKIDHPLKPDRFLVHACIEGPEAAVFYRGEGITNDEGIAEVILPDYFEALTHLEGRTIQVTPLFDSEDEDFGYVAAGRIKNGKFKVRSFLVDQRFYWEVKAVRADVPELIVEPLKPENGG